MATRASSSSMTVKGGPELVSALRRRKAKLDSSPEMTAVLVEAGRKVADEWARRVPIGTPPHDPHPGAYQRAMQSQDSVYVDQSDPHHVRVLVRPANLDDLPHEEQPRFYAMRLEYGDSSRSPEPSARPAVDTSKGEVTKIIGAGAAKVVVRP